MAPKKTKVSTEVDDETLVTLIQMEVDKLRNELLEVIVGKDAEIGQLKQDVCTLRIGMFKT